MESKPIREEKATKIDMQALERDVQMYPDVYQYERAQRFGVSARGIGYALKRLKISYKKTLDHPRADKTARTAFEPMNNTAWQNARNKAVLPHLRIHDLRHTVGLRLQEAGVADTMIADILWHSRPGMTAHYSVAQVRELYEALEPIRNLLRERHTASGGARNPLICLYMLRFLCSVLLVWPPLATISDRLLERIKANTHRTNVSLLSLVKQNRLFYQNLTRQEEAILAENA